MGRRNIKKLAGLLAGLAAAALYIARVAVVNMQYDKPEIITYEKGEVCEYKDFAYCMKTKEFLTADEMKKRCGAGTIDASVEPQDLFLVVGFDVTYQGEQEEATAPIAYFTFESNAFKQGVGFLHIALNPEGRGVRRGETKRMYLAAYLPTKLFAKRHWSGIRERRYNMVLATYPDIIIMRCE